MRPPEFHTPMEMYASNVVALTPLLTSKLFGFNVVIHFTPIMSVSGQSLRLFTLPWYIIIHWPLTSKIFSAIQLYGCTITAVCPLMWLCQVSVKSIHWCSRKFGTGNARKSFSPPLPFLPLPYPLLPLPLPCPSLPSSLPSLPVEVCPLNPTRGRGRGSAVSSPSGVWGSLSRNRIWCILALKMTSGGNNFNDFREN